MKSFLPNDIKDQNRMIVFDILMQEPNLAKVEVSERTTKSFVTVSKIIDYFEQIGIVTLNGESREGSGGLGRKRIVYSFNPNSYSTIGIQLIGRKMQAVLVNLNNQVIASFESEESITFYEEEIFEAVTNVIEYLKEKAKDLQTTITGVGIGIDGAINIRNKTIRMRSSKDTEQDYPYEEIIKKLELENDLPILIENDVNASTIAEFIQSDKAGEGPNDLLQIALGEGIGAGLILNRKLHRGHNAGVGELEYMCFDTEHVNSPSSIGWLESKLNLDYLETAFQYSIKSPNLMDKENIQQSVDYISKYMALAITNIVSLLDIETIIISGKTISVFPEEILSKTTEYINRYTAWSLDISFSERKDSTAIGAAILSLQKEMTKVISG